MAIQQSDLIDFGNGIIGDDTFDVWRKKTNSIKNSVDTLDTNLTNKINTDIGNLSSVYIPQSGSATAVSTSLAFSNPITFNNNLNIGGSLLFSQSDTLKTDKEFDSSVQLTSTKVRAKNNLILGDKTYNVPSSPAINNAVLITQTNGALSWANVNDIFSASGGFTQTTTVFEEVMPVGSVVPLAGDTNDPNFLLCEGATISKSAYPDLFDVIGYDYGGSGDNFKLPNYKGRVLVGAGTDSAGAVSFSGDIGVFGGTSNISTGSVSLTIDQMPPHRHWSPWVADDDGLTATDQTNVKSSPLFGADAQGSSLTDQIHVDIDSMDPTSNNSDYYMFTTYAGGEAGDASLTGLTDVTNAQYTGGSSSSGGAHSHGLTPATRVQPYVTIKWYIKAKKNSKIDFKINIANSGLESATAGGQGQTLISPVDETITLKANVDNTCLRLLNGEISIKHGPQISGSIKTTGPDIDLDNPDRRGGFTNDRDVDRRRMVVHGGGSHNTDPNLNGYDRKTVETIYDRFGPNGQALPAVANNDTLIINYDSVSPNSTGDYANGVIINGVNTLMFQDGSVIKTGSVPRKGNFKKATEPHSGRSRSVAPQYSDAFMYIDDEDDIVIGGNGNGYYRTGAGHNDGHTHRTKFMLPSDEKADKLYTDFHSTHVIAKSGKTYSIGQGYVTAHLSPGSHGATGIYQWVRSFCEAPNFKAEKIVNSGDIHTEVIFCLDQQGYLWGHGRNQYGPLANGTQTDSGSETEAGVNTSSIIGKRELLVNSETQTAGVPYNLDAGNRRYLPHPINPMLNSSGAVTTSVGAATSLLKITDAVMVGSSTSSTGGAGPNYETILILGSDKKVYGCGYGGRGQTGNGDGGVTEVRTHWEKTVKEDGTDLDNIEKIFGGGEDYNTYYLAVDSSYNLWGWGEGNGQQFGIGAGETRVDAAQLCWDAQEKGYRVNDVITNNAGSANSDAFVIVMSNETADGVATDKRYWYSTQGTNGEWTQLTHTVFNTSQYEIQDLYHSNGNTRNFFFVVAKNKSNNKFELWSAGNNENGQLGHQDATNATNFVNTSTNGATVMHRVNFSSDKCEKIIMIHGCRQWDTGSNTFIHLSDGRIFAAGYLRWSFGRDAYNSEYVYKFTPIPMDC